MEWYIVVGDSIREIKFRGLHNGEWVYGSYTHVTDMESGKPSIIPFGTNIFVDVEPESMGEYTGILDKNKKEIYEGDIVRWWWEHKNEWGKPGAVTFDKLPIENDFGFILEPICWMVIDSPLDSKCEVIGNIFENTDLLENTP